MSENEIVIDDVPKPEEHKKSNRFKKIFSVLLSLGVVFLLGVCFLFNYLKTPPPNFPVNISIEVPPGSTIKSVAKLMKANGFTRSELAFFAYFTFYYDPTSLKASTYLFPEPLTVGQLAKQLTEGNYSQGLIKFTHIEGERVEDIAQAASLVLPTFDQVKFIELAEPFEGKLFPETYMIPGTYNEQQLLDLLMNTFYEKIYPYEQQITQSKLSLDEIIILASILEREANSVESMQIVSGILQNRLAIGMPLQADSSIEYVLHKPLTELTPEDLKIDSPYNTYLNIGLPPTPIGNPGLDAIEAVLTPTVTDYLFYITGKDGKFYYSKDFDQHRKNIEKYLR